MRMSALTRSRLGGGAHRRARGRLAAIVVAAVTLETGALWLRASRLGGRVVVRCRDGHLFTTLWIPGVSVKSARLVFWRFQRCPVGGHWSLVAPVRESELTEAERRGAHEHADLPIP